MKSLQQYIKANKLSLIPLEEKLIINKNYNHIGLNEIYDFDWKHDTSSSALYYKDEDRKAFDIFYKYFVQCAKRKLTYHQQCKLVNKGEYLFAVNESEKKIFLFHRHMDLDTKPSLYEKFEIIPSSNGMYFHFIQMVMRQSIYPLSTKSMFTVKGTNPQYYLIDEGLWEEMKTLYNELKNR